MKRILFVALAAAIACTHRVNLNQAPAQIDAFHIACVSGNCVRNFVTSGVPAGDVQVTRNGLVLYSGPQAFDYSAAADSAGKITVTFTAQPVADGDLILLRYVSSIQPPQPPQQNVQFVKVDAATLGNWIGVYGADGYYICGDAAKAPAYGSASIANQYGSWTWAQSTADARALQKPANPADRIAAAWYSYDWFTIDVNLTDGAAHQVALYSADYDHKGRTQRFEVIEAATDTIADTRNITPGEGQYLVWTIRGHVVIRVTNTGAENAVAQGIFFR